MLRFCPCVRALAKNHTLSRLIGPPMLKLVSQLVRSVGGCVMPKLRNWSSRLFDVAQSPDVL